MNIDAAPGLSTEDVAKNDARQTTICFDITDLILYMRHHKNVSGIQRVIINIVEHLTNPVTPSQERILFGYRNDMTNAVIVITRDDTRTIISKILQSQYLANEVESLIESLGTRSGLGNIDVYFFLGAFWAQGHLREFLIYLQACNIVVGMYVYDVIAITNNDYFERALSLSFARSFVECAARCDLICTISAHVREEVVQLQQQISLPPVAVMAVPLAHGIDPGRDREIRRNAASPWAARNFVLCVGTLEGRKNHLYLAKIWSRLHARYGERCPELVLVGRWGWNVTAFAQYMKVSNAVEGTIKVLNEVSDTELVDLYDHCLFTVYPSLAEGWGLPIGESLAHGKLCLASGTSSMPEVGGDFVRYLDPGDPDDGFAAIVELLDNPEIVRAAEARIASDFRLRLWGDVARELLAAITARPPAQFKSDALCCRLPTGRVIPFPEPPAPPAGIPDLRFFTYDLALSRGWTRLGDRWVCRPEEGGALSFRPDGIEGPVSFRIGLCLKVDAPGSSCEVMLENDGQSFTKAMPMGQSRWIFFTVQSDARGNLRLHLNFAAAPAAAGGKTGGCLTLSALALAAINQPAQRLAMMEAIHGC